VVIAKPVSVVGVGNGIVSGTPATIIDGGLVQNLPSVGQIRIDAPGDVHLANLAVHHAGSIGPGVPSASIYVRGVGAASAAYEIADVHTVGKGKDGGDIGIMCDHSAADLSVANSRIEDHSRNSVLLWSCTGALDVSETSLFNRGFNSTTPALLAEADGVVVTAPQRFHDGQTSGTIAFTASPTPTAGGGFQSVEIFRNFLRPGRTGNVIELTDNGATPATGSLSGVSIHDNSIDGRVEGIVLKGGVEGTEIEANGFQFMTTAVHALPLPSGSPSGTRLRGNSLANNQMGVQNDGTETIDAEDNFWGCQSGPTAGLGNCAPLAGPVDANPWRVLKASASPASVDLGSSTQIVLDISRNSAGAVAEGRWTPRNAPLISVAAKTMDEIPDFLVALDQTGRGQTTFTPATPGPRTVYVSMGFGVHLQLLVGVNLPVPLQPPCKTVRLPISLPGIGGLTLCL
jgi:hypothetical protein